IRVDMPEGDVLKDDIVSMFPFKNNICYLELKGSDIRLILERLAASSWQVVGGGKFVVKDGKLESAEIDGAPLDDNRVYGVATISFLLNGGDDIFMARNASRLEIFDEYILDVMLPYVESLTAQGLPIEYHTDDRITIINTKDDESFRK
ncbi:MAG: 5'-nucleotidase C-terminal domain-containing protein, partial [Bacteroidales bacterium]|nr:5'-nucleotidase C-terminal domain-containing protein [Bacteroidales bacterium]